MARRDARVRLQRHDKGSKYLQRFRFRKGKPKPKQMQLQPSPHEENFYLLLSCKLQFLKFLRLHGPTSVPHYHPPESAGKDWLGSQRLQLPWGFVSTWGFLSHGFTSLYTLVFGIVCGSLFVFFYNAGKGRPALYQNGRVLVLALQVTFQLYFSCSEIIM